MKAGPTTGLVLLCHLVKFCRNVAFKKDTVMFAAGKHMNICKRIEKLQTRGIFN